MVAFLELPSVEQKVVWTIAQMAGWKAEPMVASLVAQMVGYWVAPLVEN